MTVDVAASAFLLAIAGVIAVTLAVAKGRHARAEKDGGSAFLSLGVMNAFYTVLDPLVRLALALGLSANAITFGSLGVALGAGIAAAMGHFGVAALLAAISGAGDAIDGLVARATGQASKSGEVIDSTVDRYEEFFLLAGVAVHFRTELPLLVLTLAALFASFIISYASAKAEALQIKAPRGVMRRSERAVYLTLGACLTPLLPAHEAPIIAALALVAVVGNVSAVLRFKAITDAVSPPKPRRPSTLLKHQVSSLVATAIDFGTMTALVELHLTTPVAATILGASLGAVTNFTLGRRWTFGATHEHPASQAVRYAVVSGGSALLNALGEYFVHDRLGGQYLVARAVVSLFVSLAWNYPLQRRFVFPVES